MDPMMDNTKLWQRARDEIPAPFHFKISISHKMNNRIKLILRILTFQKGSYENRIFTIFINKKSLKAEKQCNP